MALLSPDQVPFSSGRPGSPCMETVPIASPSQQVGRPQKAHPGQEGTHRGAMRIPELPGLRPSASSCPTPSPPAPPLSRTPRQGTRFLTRGPGEAKEVAGRERGSAVVCGWPAGCGGGRGREGAGARQAPGQREGAGVGEPLAGEPGRLRAPSTSWRAAVAKSH